MNVFCIDWQMLEMWYKLLSFIKSHLDWSSHSNCYKPSEAILQPKQSVTVFSRASIIIQKYNKLKFTHHIFSWERLCSCWLLIIKTLIMFTVSEGERERETERKWTQNGRECVFQLVERLMSSAIAADNLNNKPPAKNQLTKRWQKNETVSADVSVF